jgi:hypothetical protein
VTTGATTLCITVTDDTITVTDDGEPLTEEMVSGVFDYGDPAPRGDGSITLPNVRTLAEAQGWNVELVTDRDTGIRLRLEAVEFIEQNYTE